ncbi:MAG: TRAP transporter substrate-binding protein [Synergistales bacterium]|nr:TRAP transporter substrate-binding protein [Synergistales bacterium]
MKTRNLAALVLIVFVAVGLLVLGAPPQASADDKKVYHWKFQSHHPPGALATEYVIPPFIERIREMSDGRLDITLHYAGELVDYQEVFPALQHNMIQIANTSSLFWRGSLPVGWLQAGNLPPFVTRSTEEFNELYHHRGIDRLIGEGLAEEGIHFLGTHSVGNTYFWSKEPLYGVEDLEGFKVRFFGAMSDTMEHFGAAPVMLPHPETYMAIATGTLDGSGTAWWLYRDLKLYEVCPYFIGPAWQVPQGMELWVSQKAWDELPPDLQAIVETAALAFNQDFADVCSRQRREMFNKSFPEWGTEYIEWGEEDVKTITQEFSLPYLERVSEDIGPKDPRVVEGIRIVKQFMRDYGYIDSDQ